MRRRACGARPAGARTCYSREREATQRTRLPCGDQWRRIWTRFGAVCGAAHGANNTSELIGIGQALLWLRDVAAHEALSAPEAVMAPAVILFDSIYAANMVTSP